MRGVTALLAASLLVGCSSDRAATQTATESSPGSVAATTQTTPPANTEAEPDPTDPTGPTGGPTTADPAADASLFLQADGLGGLPFGTPEMEVVAALEARLGVADTDERRSYPTVDVGVGHISGDGEFAFVAAFGRSVCWLSGFCAEFGGEDAATMTFLGWHYGGDSSGSMSTESGITVGSRWTDFPTMTVSPGGCYSVGGGSVEGITLWLQSAGTPFAEFDESGNYVEHLPEPAEVSVLSLEAGDIPLFMYGDC